MDHGKTRDERKLDQAIDMTFPASDTPAQGNATGTEPPRRPASRKAPRVTKEQIDQAQRGEGHARMKTSKTSRGRSSERTR